MTERCAAFVRVDGHVGIREGGVDGSRIRWYPGSVASPRPAGIGLDLFLVRIELWIGVPDVKFSGIFSRGGHRISSEFHHRALALRGVCRRYGPHRDRLGGGHGDDPPCGRGWSSAL